MNNTIIDALISHFKAFIQKNELPFIVDNDAIRTIERVTAIRYRNIYHLKNINLYYYTNFMWPEYRLKYNICNFSDPTLIKTLENVLLHFYDHDATS